MKTAYNIRVTGKVQGVFYRASTLEKAQELELKGWCKNLSNGDVQIVAEGERSNLNALLLWCKVGPSRAIVEDVEFSEVSLNAFDSFQIRRSD